MSFPVRSGPIQARAHAIMANMVGQSSCAKLTKLSRVSKLTSKNERGCGPLTQEAKSKKLVSQKQ